MAEIIRADFNRKIITSREDTGDFVPGQDLIKAPDNFVIGREMGQYLIDSIPDINLTYLRQLAYEVNEFDAYLSEFSEYTDKELIDILALANENDWQKRPAYYRALDQEIQNRIKAKKF